MTAELRSRGTMYRKELVSKTGTRLSLPISVADSGQKLRCILLYRTVARNGGDIPLPVVCPKRKHKKYEFRKDKQEKAVTNAVRSPPCSQS